MRQKYLAVVLGLFILPPAALAQPLVQSQEGIALQNQILQLQQQVQQMQANGGGGGSGGSSLGGNSSPPPPTDNGAPPDSSVLTNLLTQVQQLQTQVQQLNGRVDTLQNQVNTQNAQMSKDIGDMKFQMGNNGALPPGSNPAGNSGSNSGNNPGGAPALNNTNGPQNLGGTLGTMPAGNTPAAPPPGASAAPATPKAAVHDAALALTHHDYATAEQNARGVLATAKSTPAGYQAQYILAEALSGEGKPQDAAIAYDDAYNRDRTGGNALGSLLGLANSLTAIHQTSAACDTLSSLNSQFPSPPKNMAPAITAAGRRAHCG